MTASNKKIIQQILGTLVAANAIVFLVLAYMQVFPSTPRAIVFIDFWGRITVNRLSVDGKCCWFTLLIGRW